MTSIGGINEIRPGLQQPAALFYGVRAAIGGLQALYSVSQATLSHLTRGVGAISRPIAKTAAEAVDSDVAAVHTLEKLQHRHARQRPSLPAKKYVAAANADLGQLAEDFDCAVSERHRVLALGLHPLGWHRPHPPLEAYLVPGGAQHLP